MTLSVGALSACGGDDPDGDGSSTTTATPLDPSSSSSGSGSSGTSSSSGSGSSTSTSAKGDTPEIPAAAKDDSDEGAIAFAKHYWSETGRALEAGDTKHLKTLTTDCMPCDEYVRTVEKEIQKGQRADRNPIAISSAKITDETDGKSDKAITLSVKDNAYEMVDNSGEPVSRVDAVNYDLIVYVDRRGQEWSVVDLLALT